MNQDTNQTMPLLLEIGTEDVPARFIPPALQQLKDNTEKFLQEQYITFSSVKTFGTPRRMAVIAEGLPLMQADRVREVFGPSRKAAFDAEGRPTKAAAGFAQSQGVSVESLVIKPKDKGEYVVAVMEEKGLAVTEVLPDLLRKIVLSVHLPKSMRWGNGNIRFVRPIRWLLALLDKEAISFEIDGIKSSNLTKGHRFLSPASFQVREIASYRKLLNNNYVLVDPDDRKKIITEKSSTLLSPFGEKVIRDDELLDTVVNLVEYPVPVLASFPQEYLSLPKELLITVMKGHQKYFAVEDHDGRITNHFIVISNTSEGNAEMVKAGAGRVIRARFEDARFYFAEDSKKTLSGRIEELRKVTFQENLGSIYDKTERMVSIAGFLADRLLPASRDSLVRTAQLAKTDLITGVVREFPELQGIMGKYYALHDGEEKEVAAAIEEHYLPVHSGGRLPQTDCGALLSITDKIDNIAAFFSIGITPTGSEDPFALRRQALGIISILFNRGYNLPLQDLVMEAVKIVAGGENGAETADKILQFFKNRLETVLADSGFSSDLVESMLPLADRIQLSEIHERLDAVRKFREHSAYNDFLTAIKRVNNIIPGTGVAGLRVNLLTEEPEKQLKDRLDAVRHELSGILSRRDYYASVLLLASLTDPINHFFDKILVMDKNEEIKMNRLALLTEIWDTASGIADFSKLSAA
jgi:glycyl-tRNA synthetase beta chain